MFSEQKAVLFQLHTWTEGPDTPIKTAREKKGGRARKSKPASSKMADDKNWRKGQNTQ